MSLPGGGKKKWWRWYQTVAGADLVRRELQDLGPAARAAVIEVMARAARDELFGHEDEQIAGDLRALRVSLGGCTYRLLYAREGKSGRVLLALHAIRKTSPKLPRQALRLAERRLSDWRGRGRT